MTVGVIAIAVGERVVSVWGRLTRWARTPEGLRFLGLLVAALAIRLLIAPFLMLTGDLRAYGYWGELALHHFFDAYSYGGANAEWTYWPVYPPLAFYVFGLLEGIYFGTAHLLGLNPSHDPLFSHALRLVLKLPAILADLGVISFIYVLARRVMSPTRALLASATYALSPGILIVTLLWGQTDGVVLLFAALGLYFAYRRQGIWAGVLLALAVGFKPQPAIFIPLGLIYLYRWGGWREAARAAASLAGVSLMLWLPYLVPPRFEILAYLRNLGQIVSVEKPTGSHGAFNLWYLFNAEWQPVAQPLVGPFSLQLVSTILFGLIMLLVLAGVWRDGSQRVLWAAAALLALGFFDVGTLQFERYLTPAVALFLLAAILRSPLLAVLHWRQCHAVFELRGDHFRLPVFPPCDGCAAPGGSPAHARSEAADRRRHQHGSTCARAVLVRALQLDAKEPRRCACASACQSGRGDRRERIVEGERIRVRQLRG